LEIENPLDAAAKELIAINLCCCAERNKFVLSHALAFLECRLRLLCKQSLHSCRFINPFNCTITVPTDIHFML
jgi:hypothetical protein